MSQLVSISKTLQLKKHATVKEFTIWSIRYEALARKEGFLGIMTGVETVGSDAAKLKLNDDGYSHLLLSVTGEKDIMTISESTTTALPKGCLETAWESLYKNYKPKTSKSKNEIIKKFYSTRIS